MNPPALELDAFKQAFIASREEVRLDLLAGIVSVESGFEPLAVRDGGKRTVGSSAGEAMGLVIGGADIGPSG